MKKARWPVELGRLRDRKARRFGVLELRSLLQKPDLKTLSVFHIALKGGAQAPALYHRRTHELFFILSGSVTGKIDGKPCRFKAGDYCFLPAGAVHEFRAGRGGAQTLEVFFPRLDLDKPDIVLV
jgi:mannose-6-phosphate isomerase-like protein (cupin superfamily)